MTLSEQVDALQAKAADLKGSLDGSRHETNEQIKARVANAKAKADAAKLTVHGKAAQAADQAHTQWQSFKADTSAKMQELQGRIAQTRRARCEGGRERRRVGGGQRGRRAGLRGLGHRPGGSGGTRCRRCSRMGRCASGSVAAQLSTRRRPAMAPGNSAGPSCAEPRGPGGHHLREIAGPAALEPVLNP